MKDGMLQNYQDITTYFSKKFIVYNQILRGTHLIGSNPDFSPPSPLIIVLAVLTGPWLRQLPYHEQP